MILVLQCRSCGTQRRCTQEQMLAMLHAHGMLRREPNPRADLMSELFRSIVDHIACDSCGRRGTTAPSDGMDEWLDEIYCEGCQTIIAPERLEVFPDTTLCPQCQSKREAGDDIYREVDYCPSCGGELRLTRNSAASRQAKYRLQCSHCGKRC